MIQKVTFVNIMFDIIWKSLIFRNQSSSQWLIQDLKTQISPERWNIIIDHTLILFIAFLEVTSLLYSFSRKHFPNLNLNSHSLSLSSKNKNTFL